VSSGKYYARFTVVGKQKWIDLETDVWSVAKLRVNDERSKMERRRQTLGNITAGSASTKDRVTVYKQPVEDRVDIKPKTKRRLREEVDTIVKTWPGFASLDPSKFSREAGRASKPTRAFNSALCCVFSSGTYGSLF
jgi:hypothetical protein